MAPDSIDVKVADPLLALRAKTPELPRSIERGRQQIAGTQERARNLRLHMSA